MCVSLKHGLIIANNFRTKQLQLHSLTDGSLLRFIGREGSGKGQFKFEYGGLCVSPDGDSVLIAEEYNNRVQQVSILDRSWVRFVGEDMVKRPQYVACNSDVIAVSEYWYRISVFSWADGSVRAQFGSFGSDPGQLSYSVDLCLLANGRELVVADSKNNRLCVFTLSGDFVATVGSKQQGLNRPHNVLQCALDDSFIVSNFWTHEVIKLGRDGTMVEVLGKGEDRNETFDWPSQMATLPDGGLVVRERGVGFQIFRGLELRKAWITVCVVVARHSGA